MAAIDRYGGALLAEAPGTGKTYVALAAAYAANGSRGTVCLVPAALREQWERTAERTRVPIVTWSHERASRASLPPHRGRLVIIDESHRLRNPATRGYAHVAPWLLGHRTLLLSATPVVNRLSDLAHQLRLAVRDDALAPHGLPSLSALLVAGRGHPALGLLVLTGAESAGCRPRATERSEPIGALRDHDEDLAGMLGAIDRLALSPDAAVAALVRGMLWRAAASSPAALAATLRRYRRLLLHAADASRAGHDPDRRALLQLTGGLGDQLLFWELLPGAAGGIDLVPDDLPLLEPLLARATSAMAHDDAKLARLRALLVDGRSTLAFSVARETVRWLRDRLGPRVAWCTGDRAGIGTVRWPRRVVLGWFRADAAAGRTVLADGRLAPEHLVCTDVAAEGLDLQGAARVVHYDLPWTPMRLDQRRGRVVRAGSLHPQVEVVRFELPALLEERLRQTEVLARKARLPAVVGVEAPDSFWRWRSELAAAFGSIRAERGVAAVAGEPPGLLVGFTLHAWPETGPPVAAHVLWWDERSGWSEEPATLRQRLEAAGRASPTLLAAGSVRLALARMGGAVRERVRSIRRAAWEAPAPSAPARALLARLDPLARRAARLRDAPALARVQRAMAFAAGGHTAGETREVVRLSQLDRAELAAALPLVPAATPIPAALQARVTGVILFLGAATFPRCPVSAPSCSISTAP